MNLPEPKNISQRAIDRGKKIVAQAPNHDAKWVDDQTALMMKEEFGLAIYAPRPLPTEPPAYQEFLKLSTREQVNRLDPHSMQCKAYMMSSHEVEESNLTAHRNLRDMLIPAFKRMNMWSEVTICQGLMKEHEEFVRSGKIEILSFDEMEKRYK